MNIPFSLPAWIGSFGLGTTFLVSPISHLIYNRFGFNRLIGISIILCTMSWISSSFVQKIQYLSVTYSLLWGIGAGLANYASTIIVQQSFHEHLSLANGLASSGTGFGTLVLGQLLTWLLERFGYKWAFRVCALVPCLFALQLCSHRIFHTTSDSEANSALTASMDDKLCNTNKLNQLPHINNDAESQNTQRKKTSTSNDMSGAKKSFKLKELFHKDLWHNMKFIIFVAGVSIFLFGAFIPFIFLVSLKIYFSETTILNLLFFLFEDVPSLFC